MDNPLARHSLKAWTLLGNQSNIFLIAAIDLTNAQIPQGAAHHHGHRRSVVGIAKDNDLVLLIDQRALIHMAEERSHRHMNCAGNFMALQCPGISWNRLVTSNSVAQRHPFVVLPSVNVLIRHSPLGDGSCLCADLLQVLCRSFHGCITLELPVVCTIYTRAGHANVYDFEAKESAINAKIFYIVTQVAQQRGLTAILFQFIDQCLSGNPQLAGSFGLVVVAGLHRAQDNVTLGALQCTKMAS